MDAIIPDEKEIEPAQRRQKRRQIHARENGSWRFGRPEGELEVRQHQAEQEGSPKPVSRVAPPVIIERSDCHRADDLNRDIGHLEEHRKHRTERFD